MKIDKLSSAQSPRPSAATREWTSRSSIICARCCSFRSEEHTSELESHHDVVCRLLLEKKNNIAVVYEPLHLPPHSRNSPRPVLLASLAQVLGHVPRVVVDFGYGMRVVSDIQNLPLLRA